MAKKEPHAERVKTSIELPRDLWTRVRVLAMHQRRHATDLVEEALEAYLKTHKGGR